MAHVGVIQEARAVRHIPLPPLLPETEPSSTGPEDLTGDVQPLFSQSSIVGGFIGDGLLAWRAVGPTVEIIETSTGSRKAAWTFGVILHNAAARVSIGYCIVLMISHLPYSRKMMLANSGIQINSLSTIYT